MSKFEFFSKDPSWLQEAFTSLWGHLDICPLLNQFHLASILHSELSSLTSLKAWGDTDGAAADRVYGHAAVWVNP